MGRYAWLVAVDCDLSWFVRLYVIVRIFYALNQCCPIFYLFCVL